jgi:methylmalonyl-CoA mutase N-terminal domain/subunit
MGGMVTAIETGYVQMEIQKASYQFQKEAESGEKVIVGLNKFMTPDEEIPFEVFKVDPEMERIQKMRIEELRRGRDNGKVKQVLDDLETAARKDTNLMPRILEAVKAYATLGEICGVLKGVFGEYKEGGSTNVQRGDL